MKTDYFKVDTNEGHIWVWYDYPQNACNESPLIILTPAYETKAMDYVSMSFFFVMNGFRVIRFNPRNSIGLSSGEMKDYTMTSLVKDIGAIVDYAEERFDHAPITIISLSLSSRALLRYLSSHTSKKHNIKLVISIVGVVNLRSTVKKVSNGKDMIAHCLNGKKYGVRKFLNHDLDYENFLEGSKSFFSLSSAIRDARKITIPHFVSITSENDEWISNKQQTRVYNFIKADVEHYEVKNATHMLWKNPQHIEQVLKKCVSSIYKYLLQQNISDEDIISPDLKSVIKVIKNERRAVMCIQKNFYEDAAQPLSS